MIKTHTDPRYDEVIHSPAWRKARTLALQRDHYLCQDCKKRGILTPAQEVHHVVPLESIKDSTQFRVKAYALDNLVSLCRSCHVEAHNVLASHSSEVRKTRTREAVNEFTKNFF